MFEANYVWLAAFCSAILGVLFGFVIGQGVAYRDCANRERATQAAKQTS